MSYLDELKKKRKSSSSTESSVITSAEDSSTSGESYLEQLKKKRKASLNTPANEETDKPVAEETDVYDYDAGAARIERLKYYSDKAKEYNSILSGVAGNPSEQGAKNKAAFDLQNLYAEYDKEFGAKKPTTIKGETSSSPFANNMTANTAFVNNAPKVDFDKLLAEAEQKHKKASDSRLYDSIVNDEAYEIIMHKVDNTPIEHGLKGVIADFKHTNNRVKVAESWRDNGANVQGITAYNRGDEAIILPMMMNEQEKTIYNWYFGHEEYDKAEEYYQSIKGELEDRAHKLAQENVYKQSKEKPGFSSVQSIVRSVYGTPTEAIINAGEAVWEDLTGKGDGNIDRNRTADLVTTARTGVSEDMSPVGRFLYNTAMSGADSLLSGLSFGNAGGVALALSAGSSTYNEALDKGMDANKAATYGLMSAVFEGVFESISLGRLLKEVPVDTWVDVVKNLAISMGVNASEEMATEIANLTYDSIANGEFSQFAELREQGLGFWDIMGKFGLQTLESGASGALMGFGFGGIQSGASAVNVVRDTVNTGKGIKNKGLTDAYIESGLQFEGTEAYNAAIKAQKKATNYRVGRLSQTLTKSALQTSFTEATGSKETATNLTDVIMGREVSKSAISDILGNEKALNALNETLGTSIKKDTDTKTFRKEVAEAVVRQTDDVIDSLGKLGDSVKELVRGEIISDKEIDAVLKNKKAREVLSLRTGVEITKDSTVQEVKQALAEANNDYSRAKQAVLFASTLNMGVNGTKAVARLVANSSGGVASTVLAFNAVYQTGKHGKAISEARNPYLSELTMAQRLAAYEYGVMDGLVEQSESKKKATEEAEISREGEVPEGAIVTKGGETVVPVKENTKEQTRIIDMGKKLGVEVAFGKITKKGKNIDGLFDGKVLYINPKTTSGSAAYVLFKHEFTHFLEKSTKYINFAIEVTESKAFSEWLKKKGFKNSTEYYAKIIADYKQIGKNLEMGGAQKEAVANFCAEMLYAKDDSMQRFVDTLSADNKRTFGQLIRDFIEWIKKKLGKVDEIAMLEKKYAEVFQSKRFDAKSFVAETKDTQANFVYAEQHKQKLSEKYSSSAAVDLTTLEKRYDKILEIWERLGGQLDSKFLNEWNSKIGRDRAFTVFKAQSGYKYNVELSSMCKKGVPLFEAIDTIVKEEAMKELKVNKLGKAEKEILYDLLKSDGFDIPCAICYVEQARQREGDIINAFLNGNDEGKAGWNQVLHEVEAKMANAGVDYKFPALDRSVATDKYVPATVKMTESEQNAFYEALKEIANREITKYNESRQGEKKFKPRKLVTSLTPTAINDVFKGNISSDIKIFKVLFQNPDSRFTIESDLLYASTTTHNLAYSHNALYSLFNQQGGVSGYKTKQGNVVYWGDILDKKWEASKLRKEGGIRYQSNSDSQMYTLLDQVQMFIDLTAKGYYLQSYSKVLSYLKLLGLSKGKINASLIPKVVVYRDADGNVDWVRTQENAGLDENGNPIYDDIEGINHEEAFMLIKDADYSKSVGGVCIGYSDNHIRTLLDDSRIQLIIGFHDKTNNPDKRYRGARYAKNYNGINEAVDSEGKTVHIGFNQYVRQAEGMFTKVGEGFEGTTTHNGKTYDANDIPRLAADLYLEMCAKKGYAPAYNIPGIVDHKNYYKLLADFSLYDSKGNYAPHQKVEYNMPDQVPYLDENGHKRYMSTERYIRNELQKELKVRDDIAEKLADKSEDGLIPRFIKAVNGENDIQADNGTPGNNQDGVSEDIGNDDGTGDLTSYSYTPDKEATSTREILANMMDTVAESEREKNLLAKYKGYLERIDNNKAEIARLKEERKAASKAKKNVFTSKIQALEKDISDTERRLSNLETMDTIKRLVEKERQAMADEAHLAGQMAQGRKDARTIRRAREESKKLRESRDKSVESRHKTAVKEDISNTVKELDTLLRKGTKEKNIHYGLQDAVASALDVIDINQEKVDRYYARLAKIDDQIAELIAGRQTTTKRYYELIAERNDIQRNKDTFNQKLEKMRDAYQDILTGEKAKDVAPYYKEEAKVIQGIVEETRKKVKDVAYEDMNLEQLEQVYKMYKMILTNVQNANKVLKGEKLADLVEDAAKIEHDLGDIHKLKEERWVGAEKARAYIWNELTPYYAFNRIGSETLMEYYWDLVRGQDTYARDVTEAKNFAQAVRKKYGYKNWDLDKTYTIKDKNGKDFSLSLKHMMSIYAYSKREQAKDHMEKGGFFFNDKETFRKDKKGLLHFIRSNETGYKVDEGVMTSILELMAEIDENTIAYVDEMQEYLTKMGEKGNEVTRKMWGIDIFKEKFYFPLKSKEDFIYQANTPAETSSLKNDGMTKETKPHASNPIVLEAFDSVWDQHVEKMSKYHAFVIPIDNLNKVINYGTWADGESKSITTMIRERYSSAAVDYLTTFIKDMNGAKGPVSSGWTFVTNLVSKFKKTAVAASMSVVVQQPTAILRALSEVNAKYFTKLPKAMGLNAKWDLIQKYAPVATIKDIGGYDAGGGRSVIDWMSADTKRGLDKAMNKIDDLTMYGAALGDRLGWGAIWTAVENEVADTTKLERGSEEFYEAVGKRFTEVIVKTQVYDSTLSRSGFMRGKDGLIKMAMAFKGEPTLSINMIMDALLQANRGKISKKQAARTIAAVYASIIAATLAKALIYALRDDDEDESYLEKYMQAVGSNIISDTIPIAMLPIFSDIWSIAEGFSLERTDMSIIVDLRDALTSLDSENKTTYRKIEDLAGAMGGLFGIPAKNILRSFREGYNVFENIFDGVDFGDIGKAFAEGVTGNEATKSESLYNAVMNKDTARINIYRDDYKDESTYTSALKRSLRENDPRVVKSVERALLGDYTLYNNSKRVISSTSKYGVKLVNEAFADEREYVLNKLDEARKARKNGDLKEYNKIIDQLVARGYSKAFILKKLK